MTNYHIEDNNLIVGRKKYLISNIVRVRLVDSDLIHLSLNDYLAESQSFSCDSGSFAHGEAIVFNRKEKYIYVGGYYLGVRHGLGQFYSSRGNLLSAGDFVNGMCVRGRIFDQNSNLRYDGEFQNETKHGFGTLYSTTRCYVGYFNTGSIVGRGFGVNKTKNNTYIGEYKNNKRHGWGMNMTSTSNFVGLFDSGYRRAGTTYWKPNGQTPYFGFPIQTRIKCVNKTEQLYYAKTRWQNKVTTENYLVDEKICGLTKIVFPTGIVFHTNFNDGEIDSWFLFSLSPTIDTKIAFFVVMK